MKATYILLTFVLLLHHSQYERSFQILISSKNLTSKNLTSKKLTTGQQSKLLLILEIPQSPVSEKSGLKTVESGLKTRVKREARDYHQRLSSLEKSLFGTTALQTTYSFLEDFIHSGPCSIQYLTDTALEPVHNLNELRIENTHIGVSKILQFLKPLLGTTMDVIEIDKVSGRYGVSYIILYDNKGILNLEKTQYLIQICARDVSLTNNNIFVIEVKHLEIMNVKTSIKACFTKTSFPNGTHHSLQTVSSSLIKQLTIGGNRETPFNKNADGRQGEKQRGRQKINSVERVVKSVNLESVDLPIYLRNNIQCTDEKMSLGNGLGNCYHVLDLSNSIKYIPMTRLFHQFIVSDNIHLIVADNLTYPDLRENRLERLTARLTGLSSLQTQTISGDALYLAIDYFFDETCNLVEMNLSNCRLDPAAMANHSELEFEFFSSLSFLRHRRRNSFSFIKAKVKATTWVRLDDDRNFTCMNNEGHLCYWRCVILNVNDDLLIINDFALRPTLSIKICSSSLPAIVLASMAIVSLVAILLLLSMVIGIFTLYLIWKNQTFVKLKLLQLFTVKRRRDYKIGVFIGYADKDYTFPCHELRTFIECFLKLTTYICHRDMEAGIVARSILDAVNASWRIVLVFSENFLLNDEWSMFTVSSAIYALSPENPARVVVLVHENLRHRLPDEVLNAVSEENIIVVPSWEMSYDLGEKLMTRLK